MVSRLTDTFNKEGWPGALTFMGSGKLLGVQLQGPSIPVGLEMRVVEVSCSEVEDKEKPVIVLVYEIEDYCRDKPKITYVVNPNQGANEAFKERFGLDPCS